MTRAECEGKLIEKLHEIQDVLNEYAESEHVLSVTVKPGYVSAFRINRDIPDDEIPSSDDFDIDCWMFG